MSKEIIVTGGCGFIGSEFIKQYGKCIVIDKLTYAGDSSRIKTIFFHRDISEENSIEHIFRLSKPEFVVNFSAETHVDNSIIDCMPFIKSNIIGVKVLCDLCLEHDCKLIHISTDEVYGDSQDGLFTEDSNFKPNNPYSATKASAEMVIRSYIKTYGLRCSIIRPSNNYGPNQNKEKFIPKIIINARDNKKIPVYGKGEQIREWTHVSDTCRAIRLIMQQDKNDIFNVGSGFEQDNLTTVKMILNAMDKPFSLIEFVQDRPGHDFRYSIDSSKIRSLGWRPLISFEEGIKALSTKQ